MNSKDVCRIYELLLEHKLVHFPITRDGANKVDAIVASLTNDYFGQEIYKTAEEKAVAYFYFLIKGHPFTDGNKRTASVTFLMICELNNLEANYNYFALDQLAVYMEKIREKNHHNVIKMLADLIFTPDSSKHS